MFQDYDDARSRQPEMTVEIIVHKWRNSADDDESTLALKPMGRVIRSPKQRVPGTCVHMCTEYEVSMSNPVPGEVCTYANANANDDARRRRTTDNSWLHKAIWLISQMSQKVYNDEIYIEDEIQRSGGRSII